MDKERRPKQLSKGSPASELLAQLRKKAISFQDFEASFHKTLSSDIDVARYLVKGLKSLKNAFSPLDEANKQRLIAHFHEVCSEHRKAIIWSAKAIESYRQQGNSAQYQCLLILMTSHGHLGNYSMARYYAGTALSNPNLSLQDRLKIHANLGGLAYRVHDYATSKEQYMRALNLDEFISDRTKGVMLYNLGVVLTSLNQFAQAEEHFAAAIELFLNNKQTLYYGHALQSFGHLYTILGQYFHAEEKLRSARDTYLEGGDLTGAALCDVELIRLDTRLNRFDRILDRIPALVKSFRKQGRGSEMGMIYFYGVYPAIILHEYLLAQEYLSKAIRIFKKEKNLIYLANCSMLEGVLIWRQKGGSWGLDKIVSACESFHQLDLAESELECLIYIHHMRNTQDEALLLRVRHILKSPVSPAIRIQGLVLLSEYWRSRQQMKRCVDVLFEAVNLVEESRASISNQTLRASFFQDKVELYELLIERLLEWGVPRTSHYIFQAVELSRSRQMMDLLSRRDSLPPILNREEPRILDLQRLDLRLKQLNRKQEQIFGNAETPKEEKETLLTALSETRKEIVRVRKEMRHENRISLFYPLEFRPEDIRSLLEPGHLLALFFLGKKMLYRIELGKTSLNTYQYPIGDNFKRDFETALNILSNRITPKTEQALALCRELSRFMVPNGLEESRHITFILHKTLQRFPLALLSRTDGRFLIETHTISQAPNLPVFYFTQRDPKPDFKRPVFFFSDSEEDPVAAERVQLQSLFPEAILIRSLEEASVVEGLKSGDFIHFAGHCVFDKRFPDKSYLQLGGGKMSLKAFAELGFDKHPFLNLATCQSGWVAMSTGNEPHGFVIGSFAAGASSLLAALWEVDDVATAYWMNVFYAALDLGLAGAFRKACLETKAVYPDPYLWAGFCLMGKN